MSNALFASLAAGSFPRCPSPERSLCTVQDQRGIKLALLVSGTDNLKHSTAEVDKLSVIANHSALLDVATAISERSTLMF